MKDIKIKNLVILAVSGIIILLFCLWQNNDIVVSHFRYSTHKISDDFSGYTIAHISDLHNKKFGKNQKSLLNILIKENPDIVVITGDIVDSKHTDIDSALEFVKGAVEIAPTYYVTGNHESWLSENEWNILSKGMEQYGVTMLDNKAIDIRNESDDGFYLIGLSDLHLSDDTLKTLCSSIEVDQLKIVLAHEPQNIDHYSNVNVDLVLSGHAHGGQIRLPLIGGLFAPGQGLFPKYTSGSYIKDNTTMIVSRGLGNSIFPVRVFNRPEVVIIKLQNN